MYSMPAESSNRRTVLKHITAIAAGLSFPLAKASVAQQADPLPAGSNPDNLVNSEDEAKQLRQVWNGPTSLRGTPWTKDHLAAVGHSHLVSLMLAFRHMNSNPTLPNRATFIQLRDKKYIPAVVENAGTPQLTEAVSEALDFALSTQNGPVPFLAASIGGAEYQPLALVNHPQHFDFVMPGYPRAYTDEVEIVPIAQIRARLNAGLAPALRLLRLLRAKTELPIYQLEPPPPVGDNAFLANPKSAFYESIQRLGVAPPPLRLKIWKLQSEIREAECKRMGVQYLPAPAQSIGPDGFLVREGWSVDGVHATAWYGGLVLQQLANIATKSQVAGGAR
jgi:hypothetical protein